MSTQGIGICLALETGAGAISAAVFRDRELIASLSGSSPLGRAEELSELVDSLLRQAELSPSDIDIVSTSTGPGSFTGIRVGLSFAKGLRMATGAELRLASLMKALGTYAGDNGRWISVVRTGAAQTSVFQANDGTFRRLSTDGELETFLLETSNRGAAIICDSRITFQREIPGLVLTEEPFAVAIGRTVSRNGFVSEPEGSFLDLQAL